MLKSIRFNLVIVLLVFLICSTTSYAAQFKFQFNPPEVTATQTFKHTEVTDLGAGEPDVYVYSGQTKVEFKKTSTGYAVIETPISIKATRNDLVPGEELRKIFKVIENTVVTSHVDKNGKLTDIRGFEQLSNQIVEIIKNIDPELAPEAEHYFASVKESEKASAAFKWDTEVAAFNGREFNIGDVWDSKSEIQIPLIGEYNAAIKIRAAETVMCGGKKCIRMKFSYTEDAKSLPETLNKMIRDANKSEAADQLPTVVSATITGQGQRIIDPSTMLTYSETTNNKTEAAINIPGRGIIRAILKDYSECSFNYH